MGDLNETMVRERDVRRCGENWQLLSDSTRVCRIAALLLTDLFYDTHEHRLPTSIAFLAGRFSCHAPRHCVSASDSLGALDGVGST